MDWSPQPPKCACVVLTVPATGAMEDSESTYAVLQAYLRIQGRRARVVHDARCARRVFRPLTSRKCFGLPAKARCWCIVVVRSSVRSQYNMSSFLLQRACSQDRIGQCLVAGWLSGEGGDTEGRWSGKSQFAQDTSFTSPPRPLISTVSRYGAPMDQCAASTSSHGSMSPCRPLHALPLSNFAG